MRVIAGEFRGRTLRAPKGRTTRPTTDRVREAMMSAVFSARGTFEGAQVLDAFAGSGALGIEALSRGACHAVFYESNKATASTLEENLQMVDESRYLLVRSDVFKATLPRTVAFDLVFLDPPYATQASDVVAMLERFDAAGALAAHCVVVYEHAATDESCENRFDTSLGMGCVKHRVYHDTAVDIFERGIR